MEREGRMRRSVQRAKDIIFKNQERAFKVAYSEYAGAVLSLIGLTKSIEHNLPGVITYGLFALATLFVSTGVATEEKALYTPSRDPIRPTEGCVRTYLPPHPPTR